ncbi:MAG: ABC transporter ATP-binding protein [Peptococcaceae bacterium]|nr:ABC transporter ATP-binding protein [Peptococcaceae bacterium]
MIRVTNVTKKYARTTAIDRVSLSVSDSGIYCLLGRNGAGKTTLMKLLAGHLSATEGQITVEGKRVLPSRMPDDVTYIESGSKQFNMKVSQVIDTAAALQDSFDLDFAQEMVKRFELSPTKKYKQLSLGMKTMLTTIIALANNSKVILLDEPTLGFDAIMRAQFNTLLMESYQAHPRVLIISTHLIDEIAKVTEQLIIIDNGKIMLEVGIDDIDEKAYTLSGPANVVEPILEGLNCIGKTTAGSVVAAHIYGERVAPPESVAVDRMSLQDFFINMVGGESNG